MRISPFAADTPSTTVVFVGFLAAIFFVSCSTVQSATFRFPDESHDQSAKQNSIRFPEADKADPEVPPLPSKSDV